MRNTTKLVIVVAVAALAVIVLVPRAVGNSTQGNVAAQTPSGGLQNYPAAYQNYPQATSGCNDAAAQVTGFDPISGVPCDYAQP